MSLLRVLAMFALLSSPFASRAQAQLEPNESCGVAIPLAPGVHSTDAWELLGYAPWIDGYDVDWFQISLPAGATLSVTVTRTGSTNFGRLTGFLLAGSCGGSVVGTGEALQDGNSFQFLTTNTSTQPIDCRLEAEAWILVDGSLLIDYTVDVVIVPASCSTSVDDRFEVGPGIPVPIAPGHHAGLFASAANDDEYTLRVPAGASLRFAIDFANADGDLDLQLRDGVATYDSNGHSDHEVIVYSTAPPAAFRDVVVRVRPRTASLPMCNHYDLSIEVLQQPLGASYCQAGVNGYGTEARILSAGSASVQANGLSFVCQAFPATNAGVLIGSTTQAQVPFGDGFRCVGGSIVRLGASSAANGVATYGVDLASGPGLAITPGTTWNFQVFYRDQTLPGGAGFNLTDAVAIPMTP